MGIGWHNDWRKWNSLAYLSTSPETVVKIYDECDEPGKQLVTLKHSDNSYEIYTQEQIYNLLHNGIRPELPHSTIGRKLPEVKPIEPVYATATSIFVGSGGLIGTMTWGCSLPITCTGVTIGSAFSIASYTALVGASASYGGMLVEEEEKPKEEELRCPNCNRRYARGVSDLCLDCGTKLPCELEPLPF